MRDGRRGPRLCETFHTVWAITGLMHRYGSSPSRCGRAAADKWTKENPTYCVIFDLGMFVGEFVIEKRPWCHWALMQETPDKPSIKKSIAKLQPALFFQPKGDPMDPIGVAWLVLSDRRSPGIPTPRVGKGELVG